MTYDPRDMTDGLIANATASDPGVIARTTRRLDGIVTALVTGSEPHNAEWNKAQAAAFTEVLSWITCYTPDQVKEQLMMRHHWAKDD